MQRSESSWAACIVYFQDHTSLLNLLNSLEQQSLKPGAVFIADNNSTQSISVDFFTIPIHIVKLNRNRGFAAGANVAIRDAIDNGFCNMMLLSQDVLLEVNAAKKMVTQLNVSRGIVFPTMYNRNTDKVFSKGGTVNKYVGRMSLSTLSSPKNPEWADGSCLLFTKDLFNEVGGFYEEYFMYFEDIDFCYRSISKGFSLSHVNSKVSQTPRGPDSLLRSRNSIIFARRSGSTLLKLSVTKRNFLGSMLSLFRFSFQDSINRFVGIIRGWRAPID